MSMFEHTKHFERLKEEQLRCLRDCEERLKKWQKFKDDYLRLRERVETLPHQIKYDVMVPFSKYGFMPGKLVHTNEILVLLGDNWFVEKSAKQACDLIDRRLIGIDKFIDDLIKEKTGLTDQFNWTEDVLKEKSEYVNIEEKIEEEKSLAASTSIKDQKQPKKMSEEEKKELRRKLQEKALKTAMEIEKNIKADLEALHKKNGKENDDDDDDVEDEDEEREEIGQKIVEKKIQNQKQKAESFIDSLRKSLDSAHIEDDLIRQPIDDEAAQADAQKSTEELKRMMNEYTGEIDRENNSKISMFITEKAAQLKQISKKKAVRFDDEGDNDYDDYQEDDEDDDEDEEDDDLTDDDEEKEESEKPAVNSTATVIKIKHTPIDPTQSNAVTQLSNSTTLKINTPSDIFRVFYKPKSILKASSTQNLHLDADSVADNADNRQVSKRQTNFQSEKENRPEKNQENGDEFKFEPQKAFTGEIMERNFQREELTTKTSEVAETKQSSASAASAAAKPTSKFRANKSSQK